MTIRSAGGRWRLLVHDRIKGQRMSGASHNVSSDPGMEARHAEIQARLDELAERRGRERQPLPDHLRPTYVTYPDAEFDELVVGRWCHIEQMNTGVWWMNIGGVTIWIKADRDGRPKRVNVYGPGDYADVEPNCAYTCTWRRPDDEDRA